MYIPKLIKLLKNINKTNVSLLYSNKLNLKNNNIMHKNSIINSNEQKNFKIFKTTMYKKLSINYLNLKYKSVNTNIFANNTLTVDNIKIKNNKNINLKNINIGKQIYSNYNLIKNIKNIINNFESKYHLKYNNSYKTKLNY
jgi:hypothetical protein